jgi:hypothetical protein
LFSRLMSARCRASLALSAAILVGCIAATAVTSPAQAHDGDRWRPRDGWNRGPEHRDWGRRDSDWDRRGWREREHWRREVYRRPYFGPPVIYAPPPVIYRRPPVVILPY